MPQMAPYNWLTLFYLFNFIMIYITTVNHFTIMKYISSTHFNMSNKLYIWKW